MTRCTDILIEGITALVAASAGITFDGTKPNLRAESNRRAGRRLRVRLADWISQIGTWFNAGSQTPWADAIGFTCFVVCAVAGLGHHLYFVSNEFADCNTLEPLPTTGTVAIAFLEAQTLRPAPITAVRVQPIVTSQGFLVLQVRRGVAPPACLTTAMAPLSPDLVGHEMAVWSG